MGGLAVIAAPVSTACNRRTPRPENALSGRGCTALKMHNF